MHHVHLAFQCIYGCNVERGENGDEKEGSEIHGGWERRLPGLLYADDLVLYGESENLRVMVGQFVECVEGED